MFLTLLPFGCAKPAPATDSPKGAVGSETGAPAASADPNASEGVGAAPNGDFDTTAKAEATDSKLPESFACGEHQCFRFANVKDVLPPLVVSQKARVIAFGEAHTPADFQGTSTVRRFTEEILPSLAPGSSHLLVELLKPPANGCEKEKEATHKEAKEITQGQSQNNQNEYLTLGHQARALGVVPDILRATCEDLGRIAAPEGGVFAMMETIATLSTAALGTDLEKTRPGRPLILAYGGALHNDAAPRPERSSWSYGPALIEKTGGAYLEVDLIVPELVRDTDSWKSFPWYNSYVELDLNDGAVLMKWGEHSYSVFFQRTKKPG